MKSDFMSWFVSQHKSRTDSGMPKHADQQLRDMGHAGRVAERVLACRELWDEKRQSALYAWTARDRQHSGVGPADEAHWYCVSRDGMATLCVDEEDAKLTAANEQQSYPRNGPYRAARLVDA